MVSQEMFLKSAVALQKYIQTNTIPYVNNGMTLDGMDCQGMCEFLLIQAGESKADCSYAGSNDMWRNALSWRGTPEECIAQFGVIPQGAWLFIHSYDGGEPSHYADNDGNASHVGVYIGDDVAIHASASRGRVAESTFKGKAINGGWNQVGLSKQVQYGEDDSVTTDSTTTTDTTTDDGTTSTTTTTTSVPTIAVPDFSNQWQPLYSNYTWRMGDKGNGVRDVQTGLQKVGYDLGVDGDFGMATDWAVKHFQTANNLTADGIVGQNTWTALISQANAMG